MTTALILAGHGSHISPETAGVVWAQVDRLRAMGVADEVTAAFWKEGPSFHGVFKTLVATDITVIPVFTARGYFTQTVIPTEMSLIGPITLRDGRTIRYTATLGDHPGMARIVRRSAEDGVRELGEAPERLAIAILGHSTRREPHSREATEARAAEIRALGLAGEVLALYLDDSPGIEEIYERTTAPGIVAVPYFLAPGSHTTIDIPGRLGLQPGQTSGEIGGRRVIYTRPVGIDDSLTDMILDLAREADAPLREPRDGSAWDCFPMLGQRELEQAWRSNGSISGLVVGQIRLRGAACRDGDTDGQQTFDEPGRLRAYVRGWSGTATPFRPLSTAADLPGGWNVPVEFTGRAHQVIETIYPGLTADLAAVSNGSFAASTLETALTRQTGMFRDLVTLKHEQYSEVVAQVCGNCIRHPMWFDGKMGQIPCAEPCNYWMSQAIRLLDGAERETG